MGMYWKYISNDTIDNSEKNKLCHHLLEGMGK